jgi:2-polyprenyl-6-methoxyphenol hydroxylase-like FAD-dependent oxidoreductase
MKVIVIGAGIGGLAAAVALQRKSIDVRVFERAAEMTEVGAGISLWANALHALDQLGVGDAIRAASSPYEVAGLRTAEGEILASVSSADLERQFGVATIITHRADLLGALLRAVKPGSVRPGKELLGVRQASGRVTATFADGSFAEADACIGADGLRSVVRTTLHGSHPPRYAGCTAWRAVVHFSSELVRASESWGHGSVFGQVPMSGGRVYWYATRNGPEGGRNADEKAELLRLFGAWHRPILPLIEAADPQTILRNDIYDRPPLRRWGEGRVTLLGDAAHPMTPYLGQGGCQALEDAVVLGQCLSAGTDVEAGLRAYERQRIPRTRQFVQRSRQAGRIAQLQHPGAVALRNAIFRRIPASFQSAQLGRMIGYRV